MAIYHKNLSRFPGDAKDLKTYLKNEFEVDITTNHALELISFLFGWACWDDMFLAHKKNKSDAFYWHDMRWHEKVLEVNQKKENVIKKARSIVDLNESQEGQLKDWLEDRYSPKKNEIPKVLQSTPTFLSKFKKRSYSLLEQQRLREGVEVITSNTLSFTQHLKDVFLKDMGNPGSIVYCDPATTLDFARAFAGRGYNITLVSDSVSLNKELGIKAKEISFFAKANEAESKSYIVNYLQKMKLYQISSRNKDSVCDFLDFFIKLVEARIVEGNRSSFLDVPLLEDVMNICHGQDFPYAEELKKYANDFISRWFPFQKKGNDITDRGLELYQFITMKVTSQINLLRERCGPTIPFINIPVWEMKRPEVNEVILIPVNVDHFENNRSISTVHEILMERFSQSPFISSDDDIFVFAQDLGSLINVAFDFNKNFKFKLHNRAKANVVTYCDREQKGLNTRVYLSSFGWKVTDQGDDWYEIPKLITS